MEPSTQILSGRPACPCDVALQSDWRKVEDEQNAGLSNPGTSGPLSPNICFRFEVRAGTSVAPAAQASAATGLWRNWGRMQ
jgi:hypothetical protein